MYIDCIQTAVNKKDYEVSDRSKKYRCLSKTHLADSFKCAITSVHKTCL